MLNDLEKQLVKIHLKESERNRLNMINLIEDKCSKNIDVFLKQHYQDLLNQLKKMTDEDFKLIAIQLEFFNENA